MRTSIFREAAGAGRVCFLRADQNQKKAIGRDGGPGRIRLLAITLTCLLLGTSVPAETVTARFQYRDLDPDSGAEILRPVAFSKVELWRYAPRGSGQWAWAADQTVSTDANGSIYATLPFITSGVNCGVIVFAENYAAVVWPMDQAQGGQFSSIVGADDGANIIQTVSSATTLLDFSYNFHGYSALHFNLAETVRVGADYAQARRDPRETDGLSRANVWPASSTPYGKSFFDQASQTLVVLTSEAWSDFLVLHEYGHYLENAISVFAPILAFHNGCAARDWNGNLVNSAEHAWMEAFANYFAAAVALSVPSGTLTGWGSTFPPWVLESQPMPCPELPAGYTGDMVEAYVSGALWDLVDQPGDLGSNEPFDTLARYDVAVFQIFDHELDVPGRWPTINYFRDAWLARGLPRQGLGSIWLANALPWGDSYQLNCPPDQFLTAPPGQCDLVVNYPAPVLNPNLPDAVITCSPPSGSAFPLGTTTVQCTAATEAGVLAACSFQVTVQSDGLLPPANGTGLFATYYDNYDFTDPKLRRTDSTINFDWGWDAPDRSMAPDRFSVRWVGEVVPRSSGALTFYTQSDDGVRLWIGGQLLIDNWSEHTLAENSGSATVEAGRRYGLKLEYYQHWGPATIRLLWSSECQPKEIVPQTQLFPIEDLFIRSFRPQANGAILSWNSKPGSTYRVQAKYHVNDAQWADLDGAVIANNSNLSLLITNITTGVSRFFRVVELPAR